MSASPDVSRWQVSGPTAAASEGVTVAAKGAAPSAAVLPVLGVHHHVGATTAAVAVAEAACEAGLRVLLIDAAPRAFSGLLAATRTTGPRLRPDGPVRGEQREGVTVRMLAGDSPVSRSDDAALWAAPSDDFELTVVDVGATAEEIMHGLAGDAGDWLRGTPAAVAGAVLVAAATEPGLLRAEAAAHQWQCRSGPPFAALAVLEGTDSPALPAEVAPILRELWPPHLLPFAPHTRRAGITTAPVEAPLRAAGLSLLRAVAGPGLADRLPPPPPGPVARGRFHRRKGRP